MPSGSLGNHACRNLKKRSMANKNKTKAIKDTLALIKWLDVGQQWRHSTSPGGCGLFKKRFSDFGYSWRSSEKKAAREACRGLENKLAQNLKTLVGKFENDCSDSQSNDGGPIELASLTRKFNQTKDKSICDCATEIIGIDETSVDGVNQSKLVKEYPNYFPKRSQPVATDASSGAVAP